MLPKESTAVDGLVKQKDDLESVIGHSYSCFPL